MDEVYMIADRQYNPLDASTLSFGLGNVIARRVAVQNNQAGDGYFQERNTGKVLCVVGGKFTRRDDTNHSGCFFWKNGSLATFNTEEPGGVGNGVFEFRISRLGNA